MDIKEKEKQVLGFIPARKGSKGISRKNVKLFGGKPLISYTLEAALQVPNMQIFLSTDDEEVMEIAESYGVESKYIRPASLATDSTPMIDVIEHGLNWLKETQHFVPEIFVLLQPTSPFRSTENIIEALNFFQKSNAYSVISASPMWTHPFECIEKEKDDWQFLKKPLLSCSRRQDYQGDYLYINGSLYIIKSDTLLKTKKIMIENQSKIYVMNDISTLELDEERDWIIGEALLKFYFR